MFEIALAGFSCYAVGVACGWFVGHMFGVLDGMTRQYIKDMEREAKTYAASPKFHPWAPEDMTNRGPYFTDTPSEY
jgi:hypothetical protein